MTCSFGAATGPTGPINSRDGSSEPTSTGSGGCPVTHYAPGIGFPTGWGDVAAAWGPTQALGIGVEHEDVGPGLGACCLPNGDCVVRTEGFCDGVFQGKGTDCDPNPCPPPPEGACCEPETGACTVTDPFACADLGFVYMGDNIPCDPNPCPPVIGACCFDDDDCVVLELSDCTDQGGEFAGHGVECEAAPCLVPGAPAKP